MEAVWHAVIGSLTGCDWIHDGRGLGIIRHKLRRPMYGVLGQNELFLLSDLDEDQTQMVETALRRVARCFQAGMDGHLEQAGGAVGAVRGVAGASAAEANAGRVSLILLKSPVKIQRS